MGASWQAFYAHLCAASIIRAMPETEIPPAMRGGSLLRQGRRQNGQPKRKAQGLRKKLDLPMPSGLLYNVLNENLKGQV